jgi:hypothetical protein
MKISVTDKAVREYIREMMAAPGLGWQTTGDLSTTPVGVSSVVDPSAAVTDPGNPNFRPQNRAELRSAVSAMIDDISDDEASDFYAALQDAAKEEEMEKEDKKVEETIRRSIRKVLSEVGPWRDTGMSYSGPVSGTPSVKPGFTKCDACDGEGILEDGTDCTACKGKGSVPSGKRKNVMQTDVGGASFKEIAKEMGYASESGAKQAVEKALQKAKFVATMEPEDLKIVTLTAMNDYVDFLNKSGELTPADVQLMKDHPAIIQGLDGFREFLEKALKRAMKDK